MASGSVSRFATVHFPDTRTDRQTDRPTDGIDGWYTPLALTVTIFIEHDMLIIIQYLYSALKSRYRLQLGTGEDKS